MNPGVKETGGDTLLLAPVFRWIGRQSWLRLGLRRRLVKLLYAGDKVSPMEFRVPYFESIYSGNVANAQEWHVYFFGGYELKELALIRDVLKVMENPLVMDIGANIGGHALAMCGLAGEVHCFEPFPPLADRIRGRIEENGITNLKVHGFGLGAQAQSRPYYLDLDSRNSATGSFLPEHTGADAVGQLEIRVGDEWVGDRQVDFVKIDIEGFEAFALDGLRRTLERSRPLILMEVTRSAFEHIEAYGGLDRLLPYPYRVYEVGNPGYPLGLFQSGHYQLLPGEEILPGDASFNVLLVPEGRMPQLENGQIGPTCPS